MTYHQNIAAISFGDIKVAALYFDRVIPIAFHSIYGSYERLFIKTPEPVPAEFAAQLIFEKSRPFQVIEYIGNYWDSFIRPILPHLKKQYASTDPKAYVELKQLYLEDARFSDGTSVRKQFSKLARQLGCPCYSIVLAADEEPKSYAETYACLALSRIPLVDVSNASWEQIMELRSDSEAATGLRRLRLFFFENYVGKPAAYIQDDLLRRLDEYDQARRKHGFDAMMSSIQVLLDSTSLQAAAVASLTAGLFGGAVAGLSAGAAVEIGKVLLEIANKRAEIRNLASGHELGYVIGAREALRANA